MKPPFYIALEGPDGAGKSTQMDLLQKAFQQAGIGHIRIREPGATDVGKQIRQILLTGSGDKLDVVTEGLLFSADRRHTIRTLVRPALAEGKWVLSDRTYLSSMVFQCYGDTVPLATLEELTTIAVEDTRPHLQIILDLPVEIGLGRKEVQASAGLTETRFEGKGVDYHQRIRNGYLTEARKHADRYAVVSAEGTPAEVHARIVAAVNERLGVGLKPVSV